MTEFTLRDGRVDAAGVGASFTSALELSEYDGGFAFLQLAFILK
jgi:hypothetical protein